MQDVLGPIHCNCEGGAAVDPVPSQGFKLPVYKVRVRHWWQWVLYCSLELNRHHQTPFPKTSQSSGIRKGGIVVHSLSKLPSKVQNKICN